MVKYTKITGFDSITEKEVPLFHPRKQKWTEHFKWNEDFTEVIGLTPIGRATIKTLNINRPQNINLRTLLFIFGYQPPKHTIPKVNKT